jgi:hypothetical protein
MNDLDLLREHFPQSPPPSDDARRQVSARLAQAIRDEAQRATTARDRQTLLSRVPRLTRTRPKSRALALATAVAVAAAVALFLSTPWKASSGFLARAEAALSQAGTILHMKLQTTSTWARPLACAVTYSKAEVWIDETPPNTYRILLTELPQDPVSAVPGTRACFSERTSELGGAYDARPALRFTPPNRLSRDAVPLRFALDPAADLRKAISAGHAHDEGKTELDGRTVERIRVDTPPCRLFPNCERGPDYIYVDPDTFYPVQTVRTTFQVSIVGSPARSHYSAVGVRDVTRYLTFEYLPRTTANLALSNIRAQHPSAIGP